MRRWRVLVCATVLVAASAPLAAAGTARAAAPTAADLGVDFTTEMQAVVAARSTPALDADRQALSLDSAHASAALARQAGDRDLLATAEAEVSADTAALAGDRAALAAATTADRQLTAAVAADHRRLAAIAVELYTEPDGGAEPVTGEDDLTQAQEAITAQTLLVVVVDSQERTLGVDNATLAADDRTEALDAHRTAQATGLLVRVQALRSDRSAVLAADATAVATTASAVAADHSVLSADLAAQAAAVAAVAPPPGSPSDGSTTILGVAALDAAQMVGWYDDQGYVDLTPATITQLASWYLSEGAVEDVRGDVAFAQAVVETGGFSSPDAVEHNNYAGIGHCDTCAAGIALPTPQLGVRQQIQLLRGLADPTLTTAELANPPVTPAVTPETEPDRGCCVTWQSLTGKWATDPAYGHTVMAVYQSMLSDALSQPPSG